MECPPERHANVKQLRQHDALCTENRSAVSCSLVFDLEFHFSSAVLGLASTSGYFLCSRMAVILSALQLSTRMGPVVS